VVQQSNKILLKAIFFEISTANCLDLWIFIFLQVLCSANFIKSKIMFINNFHKLKPLQLFVSPFFFLLLFHTSTKVLPGVKLKSVLQNFRFFIQFFFYFLKLMHKGY